MSQTKADVFISYSSQNKGVAKSLAEALEPEISCWYAPRDVPTGGDWAASIDKAIETCSLFLLVLTPESNASRQVPKEVSLADAAHRKILVVRAGEFELASGLSYHLASTQWLVADELDDVDRNAVRETTAQLLSRPVTQIMLTPGIGARSYKKIATVIGIVATCCILLFAAISYWGGDSSRPKDAPAIPMGLELIANQTEVEIGASADLDFLVESLADRDAEEVKIMVTLPSAMLAEDEKRRRFSDEVTIAAGESRELPLRIVANRSGTHELNAVVFQSGKEVPNSEIQWQLVVRAPSLKYEVDLAPWIFGNQGQMTVTVSNQGDAAARQVKFRGDLPDGLETVSGERTLSGPASDIPAGEKRSWAIALKTRTAMDASFKLKFEGANTASADTMVPVKVNEATLSLEMDGPKKVYPGQAIEAVTRIRNTGPVVVRDIQLAITPQGAAHFESIDQGGTMVNGRAVARVGNLQPGQSLVVTSRWRSTSNGELTLKASLNGALINTISTSHSVMTAGVPALLLEVTDAKDPVRKGQQVTYIVTITNQGSAAAKDLATSMTLPLNLDFVSSNPKPNQNNSGELDFRLPDLAPGARQEIRVVGKAMDQGIAQLEVKVEAAGGISQQQFEQTGVDVRSPLFVEVVDREDPVAVGSTTTYIITLTNQGSQSYARTRCRFSLSDKFECISADGNSKTNVSGNTVTFTFDGIAPKAQISYLITAKAIKAGSAPSRFTYRCAATGSDLHRSVNTVVYE